MAASALFLSVFLSFNQAGVATSRPTSPEVDRLLEVIVTDPTAYAQAVADLRAIAPAHVPELLASLGDATKSSHFRGTITSIVCRLEPRPPEIAPTIAAWAFDANRPLAQRGDLIQAIPHCMPVEDAGPLLQRALRSPEGELRKAVTRSIQYLDEPFEPLLEDLARLALTDPVPEVRCWSSEAIETFGADARKALPVLKRAARRDTSSYVRDCLHETIQTIERRQF